MIRNNQRNQDLLINLGLVYLRKNPCDYFIIINDDDLMDDNYIINLNDIFIDKNILYTISKLKIYYPELNRFDEKIYDYALLSAGGALLAAQKNGISLMRPPGHHAGRNGKAMGVSTLGFCYFNNIAIAVRKMNEQTLILDIDGHHGNGTQEIFQGDPNVKFISLHRYPTYPGTGLRSQETE